MSRRLGILATTSRAPSDIEVAEIIARILESLGFYVARHASNLIVMYSDKLLGSIHVYRDSCVFRVNPAWEKDYLEVVERVRSIMDEVCRWRELGV